MILETIPVGPMEANCYILAAGESSPAIIIDPGQDERKIQKALDKYKLQAALVVNTHGHYDHIGADDKFKVAVYAHKDDVALLLDARLNLSGVFSSAYEVKSKILPLEDGGIVQAPGLQLKVLHIPGHTAGGIALLLIQPEKNIVFTGDSLFCGSIGRTDLAGGSEALLIKGIKEKLFSLPDETIVYPGHGDSSTIGAEKRDNPFLA